MKNASTGNSTITLSVAALAAVLSFGAFADVVHAANDFQPYENDFQAYSYSSNDFQPYSDSDFQTYDTTWNDFQPYQSSYNDFQPYYNDFQAYSFSTPEVFQTHYYAEPSYSFTTPPPFHTYSFTTPSYSFTQPAPFHTTSFTTPEYTNTTTNTTHTTTITDNTCSNNSCNTSYIDNSVYGSFNTDNSINNSFNNSGNTTVATIAQVVPVSQKPVQYAVQYTYPQALSCTITASPTSVANGQLVYLSWTSYGATSAWLSDGLGNVAPNGSQTVYPTVSKYYTLTVSGPSGTQNCSTYVSLSGSYYNYNNNYPYSYVPPTYNLPAQAGYPYVALTQIPYTGLDLGAYGNALYWTALIGFALAGAYLAVYYLPSFVRREGSRVNVRASGTLSTPAIFGSAPAGKKTASFVHRNAPIENLPVEPRREEEKVHTLGVPKDAMKLMHSKHGEAPRIVITRA